MWKLKIQNTVYYTHTIAVFLFLFLVCELYTHAAQAVNLLILDGTDPVTICTH